jgi:hypothetical protein
LNHDDYTLNAKVRILLIRKGFDLAKLEYGVTNGVVYLMGTLRTSTLQALEDATESRLHEASLAAWLERTLKHMNGVRDVVFRLDRVQKVGCRWRSR